VLFRLRDEGSGISPEHLSRLTDPFFTTKRDMGGTGLGLSVSAGIVKEHGGTLEFESPPGCGTTVTLTLPAFKEEKTS
jgi:polar amino acid transport system substrate-binding protein